MHRHPIFLCHLMLFILIGIQPLRADDKSTPQKPQTVPPSEISFDRFTGNSLPNQPVKNTPEKILEKWSAASQFPLPVTSLSKVEELKKGNQAYFSGHELSLISEFQKPVSTQTLLRDYNWRLTQESKTKIILQGQPRDVLTRHLCRSFELQFNPRTSLPESLTFLSDPAKQSTGFASIELTAYKILPTDTKSETDTHPQTVVRKVGKAIFLSEEKQMSLQSKMNPIKQISFSQSNYENKNESELKEIEKLVSRWITESERIDSIKLGNGATIFKNGDHRPAEVPAQLSTKSDGTYVSGWPAFLVVLPRWLIDVDQKSFIIESFTIEFLTENTAPSAPRLITLKIKQHPQTPQKYSFQKWDVVKMEFNSQQPLPVKITEVRNNWVLEYELSEMQVHYKK